MHVAGLRPLYVEPAAVPAAVLEAERAVLAAAAGASGKPAAVVDKMVAGRLKKWYQEVRAAPVSTSLT
jgi:elongation factor Ts